jgi:hypothetical protein
MVLLGKTLKGRTTKKGEVEPTRNIRVREIIKTEAEQQADKIKTAMKEDHFRKQIQAEEKITLINRKKLMTNWRKILRLTKAQELKQELEIYAQGNQRELDSKDAFLQMLDKNIEEMEDQYNLSLRNHLIQIDKLMEIKNGRIEALREEFQRSTKILYDEFNSEAIEIKQTHDGQKKELEDMMETINKEEKEKENLAAENAQAQTEQVKQKAKEEIEQMHAEMSSKQGSLSNLLETLYQRYTNDTKDRFAKYQKTLKECGNSTKEINNTMKKIVRTRERIELKGIETTQMVMELKQKNDALAREKKAIANNFLELKNKMFNFRDKERKKLAELVINSKLAMDRLENTAKLGEKILKTAELCRRMETEREKVVPFYESTVTEEDIPEDLRVIYSEITEDEFKSFSYIKNYFKRYNKVMLDKIAIQQQKELYKKENQTLKNLLKQYIDGISVNDDVINQDNHLLVASKAKIEGFPVERLTASSGAGLNASKGNFIDGNAEMNKMSKQNK